MQKIQHIISYPSGRGPDGKDYKLRFDKENKTVTVSATFYTTASSYNSANESAKALNKQSGSLSYSEGKRDAATTYAVNFDIKIVEVEVNPEIGEKGSLNVTLSSDVSGQGNAYIVVSDSELEDDTNGTTQNGNYIEVKNSKKMEDTGAHEMGHALGLKHNTYGLMTKTSNDPNRTNKINKYDVKDMISYPLNGKVNFGINNKGQKVRTGKGTIAQ